MRDMCVWCARGAVRMVCARAPQAARGITCEAQVALARTRAADMRLARSLRERAVTVRTRATCRTSARGVRVVCGAHGMRAGSRDVDTCDMA
eukprot:8179503-Pyramimonas_sp.AAC.1